MQRIHQQPQQHTPSFADTITAARDAYHLANCDNCRQQTEASANAIAANGQSIARRDRLTLGLHHARQTPVTA